MNATLRLLGTAAIELDGVPAGGPANQRHRLALLALLAASRERSLSRDKLVGLLWPEHGEGDARHLLRQAVYIIRKELGEDVLVTAGEQVRLPTGALPSDLAAFQAAIEAGEPGRAIEHYGGPFLDGFHLPGSEPFDRWAEAERRRLASVYATALADAAAASATGGNESASVDLWRRLVEHDPYDTAAALGYMRALADGGDRGRAILHAEEHAARLAEDLDAAPDPAILDFAERLRQGPIEPVAAEPEASRPDPSKRVSLRRGVGIAIGVATVVLAAWIVWTLARRVPPTLPPSTDRVAVLPFVVRGGDESLAYLGPGMVDLLSSKIEGAGPLRSVDPRALLGYVERRGGAGSDLGVGRDVATRFGAGLFVAGSVVGAGQRIEIHATVYDADGDVRAHIPVVAGEEDEIFSLVDRLARHVVATRYEDESGRLSRLATTTTASLPALKAYLEGEAAFRAGRFDQAVEAFRVASAADSTFALAWYRRAVAAEWTLAIDEAREAVTRAIRHSDRLAERDRLLFDAWRAYFTGAAGEAERLYRRILEVHPEDVEAWYQLGEVQFHYGPLRGHPIRTSRAAFERALELEPDHEGALLHEARIAARAGDAERVVALVDRLARLNPGSELAIEMRALAAFLTGDATERERVIARLRLLNESAIYTAIWTVSYADPLVGIDRLAPILTDPDRPVDVRATGHLLRATAALARGRRAAARHEIATAESLDPARALPVRGLSVALPFLPAPADEVEAARIRLTEWDAAAIAPSLASSVFLTVHDGLHAQLRAYLLNILGAVAGDRGPLRPLPEMASTVRTLGTESLVQGLAAGAMAERLLQEGRPDAALQALDRIGGPIPYERAVVSPFFALSRERFTRATLLDRAGRDGEAIAALGTFLDYSLFDLPYLAPSHLRRAELHDRRGESQHALTHYRRFAELWRECDPAYRPAVARAQERIAELEAE